MAPQAIEIARNAPGNGAPFTIRRQAGDPGNESAMAENPTSVEIGSCLPTPPPDAAEPARNQSAGSAAATH